ncbi:MAG: 50S ribosomal protein L31 [Firmicutes bacterium]|nr:50S ribosomal protein L31 [Bacillota bacterium]
MKSDIHPNYHEVTATCACGESFKTGSTIKGDAIRVEICSKCHPYYTGKQKAVESGGRIDKFNKRYGQDAKK